MAAFFGTVWAAAVAAPTFDLKWGLSGVEYATTFVEDEGPKVIVDSTGLTISDPDSENLSWAKVTLTKRPDGSLEALAADPVQPVRVKYKPASGVLDLTGDFSLADYQQVLRTVTYVNSSQGPDTSDRVVLFEAYDGSTRSQPVTSTVTINAINDAPVLDNSGTMTLADINENTFDSLGNKVETILASAGGDRITDPDKDALEGIAVIEVGASNGTWQYSLDAGTSWHAFESVSNESAVLLNPSARIRFIPKPQFSGIASITFRAWDQTAGMNGDSSVDVTKNGGTTAYSVATETASINVVAVDDPPVVDLNGPDAGMNFSAGYLGSNVPVHVSDPNATITDSDSQVLTKATLRLTNYLDGALELLAANTVSTSITLTPYDTSTGILVLNGPDTVEAFQQVLRTATYVNSSVVPSSGARVIEVLVNDGVSDSTLVTTTIPINPDNQAPVLNASGGLTLSNIVEDVLDPPGNSVAGILASGGGDPITDPDPGALEGIAIIGADNTHGMWQFAAPEAQDGSIEWRSMGMVSDTAAVLLNTEALVRFIPAANYTGPSGNLIFRAWDQTTGINGQTNVNTSVNGGSTAFSVESAVASLIVTPVNDPPLIEYTPAGALVYEEDSPPLPLLTGTLVITDVDNAGLASATVTLVNRPNGDAEILAVTVGDSGLVAQYDAGVLQITGEAAPDVYRQVLATLTYLNASQDPDITDRQVQIVVNDGMSSSAALPLTVGIVAINDPPIVDLNGAAPGVDYNTNFYIQWRPAQITDPNMILVEEDNTSLMSVTVKLVNPVDGQSESLSARVVGTNIKQSYDSSMGILSLSGIDSVSNYQKVLRTVTYNNVLENPSLDTRTVEFRAEDATEVGPVSQSIISIQPTPTAYQFMPIIGRRSEEPNDVCSEALLIPIEQDGQYYADDRNDWFYFDLPSAADVVVSLTDFVPGGGQLIVANGSGCGSLSLLGSDGDNLTSKTVDIGHQEAGRFYIWIINDGSPNKNDPYTLRIDTTP
ncbi:MAG: Ig-like domain-containing protein [Chloroflexota bacterium]